MLLLHQDGYGSIIGGCQCCVSVGIGTGQKCGKVIRQKCGKVIHQNQEAVKGYAGDGCRVWLNSEPSYGPGSTSLDKHLKTEPK